MRPLGIELTLPSGARIRHAVTSQSREGERYDQEEQPVEGEAPAPVPLPELGDRPSPQELELYLTAVLNNADSPETARAYGYSDREVSPKHAGFGVVFHSGARVFCMLDGALF